MLYDITSLLQSFDCRVFRLCTIQEIAVVEALYVYYPIERAIEDITRMTVHYAYMGRI